MGRAYPVMDVRAHSGACPATVTECHLSLTSQLCLGIIFPQTFQQGNKSNSCLWPGGSHREQLLILQASEQPACNLPLAQGTHTDLLFPCQPLPCALRAACPDRCSESHCMALSPAANHLKLCTAEDGLLIARKLQTGSSLAPGWPNQHASLLSGGCTTSPPRGPVPFAGLSFLGDPPLAPGDQAAVFPYIL